MRSVFFLLFLGTPFVQAQTVLNSFEAISHNQGVDLHWEIKAGSTCNGILIQRSLDSVNFQTIGQIDGVCGSASAALPYSYTDESPVTFQTNYYRLLFNGTEPSAMVRAYFYHLESAFAVHPHPVTADSHIFLADEVDPTHQFQLYDVNGRLIRVWHPLSSISLFPDNMNLVNRQTILLLLLRDNNVIGSQKLLYTHED